MADSQAKLQQAETRSEQIISQAQLKADEIMHTSRSKSQAEATALRNAAIAYRDNVVGSLDVNNEIFEDLKVRMSDLRRMWFDKANEHFRESEDSLADLLNRFASGRVTIANTFAELPVEIKAENETDDN
jgi:ribosomal protein L20